MPQSSVIKQDQKKDEIPQRVKISDLTFDLGKYKTEDQKRQVLAQLTNYIKFASIPSDQDELKLEKEMSFLYEHIVEIDGCIFTIPLKYDFPSIYKFIPKFYFGMVDSINVASCKITSIEAFAFLNAPNLMTLEIYGNDITSIKCLAKNYCLSNMKNLTLYRNPISDIQLLQKCKNYRLSYFELDTDKQDKVFCEDLSFIYKLPIKLEGGKVQLWHNRQKRIMRPIERYINRYEDINYISD